jgi:hypothetical protein
MSKPTFYCYDGTGLKKDYFINVIMKDFQLITLINFGDSPFQTKGLWVEYVDFMWVEQINERFDKNSYKVKAYLKNILNDEKIKLTDKDLLYKSLDGRFMAKSQTLFDKDGIKNPKLIRDNLYIIKPVGDGACSGKDIYIIDVIYDLKLIIPKLRSRYKKAIICDYINKVSLHQGKKFHLRMYLLVRMQTKTLPFAWHLHKTGKILTAKLPYKDGDYFNSDIHDTHVKSTSSDMFFPEDYEAGDPKLIFDQVQLMCDACANVIRNVKGHEETTYAFEVFGLDILVDVNGKAWLLELNDKVGYGGVSGSSNGTHKVPGIENGEKFTKFSNEFFEWVYRYGIKEIFDEKALVL